MTSVKQYIYIGVGWLVHWQSTHGAEHIPLCGIFSLYAAYSALRHFSLWKKNTKFRTLSKTPRPPPPWLVWTQKFWTLRPPSTYHSLDILTQKNLKVQNVFLAEFWSIKKLNFSDRAWVGRWYWSFCVLKHVDQFKTKKLFIDLKKHTVFVKKNQSHVHT